MSQHNNSRIELMRGSKYSTTIKTSNHFTNLDNYSSDSESSQNEIVGKNGDVSKKSTGSIGLDFSFELVRGLDNIKIVDRVNEIVTTEDVEEIVDLFILAFATRNCRGGKGEKDLFIKIFLALYIHFPKTCTDLLKIIPDYGYWKDLVTIAEKCDKLGTINGIPYSDISNPRFHRRNCVKQYLQDDSLKVLAERIIEDWKLLKSDEDTTSISLAAKWAPRENGHFEKKCPHEFNRFIKIISSACIDDQEIQSKCNKVEYKIYRTVVSKLTKKLDIAEIKMCDGRYGEIDYEKIPSVALNKFRKAHLNELLKKDVPFHQRETGNRYPDNLDRVTGRNNLKSAIRGMKVKGGQLQPHEIVSCYNYSNGNVSIHSMNHSTPSEDEKNLLQVQWNDLRDKIVTNGGRKLLPIADVSGSMENSLSNVKPIAVSVALSILLSEINHPVFRDRVITFSRNPSWIDLSNETSLKEKIIKVCADTSNCQNTDLIKTFRMILDVAKENNLKTEDIPDLVIFSDMQFDSAVDDQRSYTRQRKSTFEIIDEMFKEAGLDRPRIIYWNLNTNEGVPVSGNTPNTVLLSGYSQSLFKYLVFGEEVKEITPIIIYRRMLDDEMYFPVREILSSSIEGVFSNYSFSPDESKL